MADSLPPVQRSANMRRVKGQNTRPELTVRRVLTAMGYRYRLHAKDLPGTPDIVFRGRRKAIQVHGCFWHQHPGCTRATVPEANATFWAAKLQRNVNRDAAQMAELKASGWRVLIVWECEIRNAGKLSSRLRRFIGP